MTRLHDVFAPYCLTKVQQELDSLVFSTSSTLSNSKLAMEDKTYPNPFRILELMLCEPHLPGIVVLPASHCPQGDIEHMLPFGAILDTCARILNQRGLVVNRRPSI